VSTGYLSLGVQDAVVTIPCDQIIKTEPQTKNLLALYSVAIRRNYNGKRLNKMRGDTKERTALLARLAKAYDIGMLQVSNAPMNNLEAIG
jgi:hypothetical protein